MGAQLSKGGVAVDGKAAGDSAAAKTNGQVGITLLMGTLSNRHHTPSSSGLWLPSTSARET